MLAFTTADTDSLLPQPVDQSKEVLRYEMQTNVVHSGSCRGNLSWCPYDKLDAEQDIIELPRSITFEFPAPLVSGVYKDGSGISLAMWHTDLSPMPRERGHLPISRGRDADGKEIFEHFCGIECERRKAGDTTVHIAFRNFYYAPSFRPAQLFGPLWTAPGCDITDLGHGIYQYRHKPGYDWRDKKTFHLRCASGYHLVPDNGMEQASAYSLYIVDKQGRIELSAVCPGPRSLCVGSARFEQWQLSFHFQYQLGVDFPPVYRRAMALIRSGVIARSYPIHTESENPS